MKYLLLTFLLSGCATISPYKRGCMDGIKGLEPQLNHEQVYLKQDSMIEHYCSMIEARNKDK